MTNGRAQGPLAPSAREPPTTPRSIPAFEPVSGSVPTSGQPPAVGSTHIDPVGDQRIERALGAAAPLLLLPLRLEYRVVNRATPIRVTAGVSGLFSGDASATVRATSSPNTPNTPRNDTGARTPLVVNELSLASHSEIWFRWFPEDDFAQRGVGPPSDDERLALAAFDVMTAGKPWYDATGSTVISAWPLSTGSRIV